MDSLSQLTTDKRKGLLKLAFILACITVGYNLIEGLVSTIWGAEDETLALFGFGLDSFVEVISGVGILHLVWRLRQNPVNSRDSFEQNALRITGVAFYLLAAGLVIGAALTIINAGKPHSTTAGLIIAVLSIVTMWFLYRYKLKVGTQLDSAPIVADAKCTKTCFYLSFILLASSLIYMLFEIPYIDAAGSLGIAWFAFSEGREAFQKARSGNFGCGDCC